MLSRKEGHPISTTSSAVVLYGVMGIEDNQRGQMILCKRS